MPDDDVATALSELERKLQDLEDELHGGAHVAPDNEGLPGVAPPAPAPATNLPMETVGAPVTPPDTSIAASAPNKVGSPTGQLAELVHFRDQLERSAREFLTEYERVLESLRATTDAALAAAYRGAPAPAPASLDAVSSASEPPATTDTVADPWPPAASTAYAGLDTTVLDGAIAVDAGPFSDIATLSGFEQALGSVPGVHDVHVRAFESSRALIDVTLGQPIALGTELRRTARVAFTITQADAGRLTVAVEPGA